MGSCCSSSSDPDETKNSKSIDKQIRNDSSSGGQEIKLLLLGAGESGKSTIFKQMKIIHNRGYSRDECISYKPIVYSNTLMSMKVLINAAIRLGIPITNLENVERAQRIASLDADGFNSIASIFTPEIGSDIVALWEDSGIQATYKRSSEFQLNDSAAYYFDSVDRIASPDYIPSVDDVLRSRVKTTGVVDISFSYGGLDFRMYDVGGQRNERKKWIHCFQGVTAVIFVTSLSEYDQRCYEDDETSRIRESLLLFDEICNSRWFAETSIILFLNKVDLFKEKIRHTDLKVAFPDYTGGCNFDNACKFIANRFSELNKSEYKTVYCQFTVATETDNVRKVFLCVKDIILQNNLRDNGLI